MNEYKFTQYPSNSSVASGITMLVSVWFLVAAGAILSEPVSPYTQRALAQAAPLVHTADASASAGSPAAIAPRSAPHHHGRGAPLGQPVGRLAGGARRSL